MPWQTFTAPAEANVTQNGLHESPITTHALERLDSIPLPLSIEEPRATLDGHATVEFYIDELGNVRGAKLLDGNNFEFGRNTIESLARWRFQPPRSHGLKTNTVVRQTFNWSEGQLRVTRPL